MLIISQEEILRAKQRADSLDSVIDRFPEHPSDPLIWTGRRYKQLRYVRNNSPCLNIGLSQHMSSKNSLIARVLTFLAHYTEIVPHTTSWPTFLDLGSGVGGVSINVGAVGWDSYGIESEHEFHHLALHNLSRAWNAKLLDGVDIDFAEGNFFPEGFMVCRGPDDKSDMFGEYCRDVPRNTGCYEQLGLSPDEVDVFYHYQVERTDNLLRFLAEYGKDGAFLLLTRSMPEKYKLPLGIQEFAYSSPPPTLQVFQKVPL